MTRRCNFKHSLTSFKQLSIKSFIEEIRNKTEKEYTLNTHTTSRAHALRSDAGVNCRKVFVER